MSERIHRSDILEVYDGEKVSALTAGNMLTMLQLKPSTVDSVKTYMGIPGSANASLAILQSAFRAPSAINGNCLPQITRSASVGDRSSPPGYLDDFL